MLRVPSTEPLPGVTYNLRGAAVRERLCSGPYPPRSHTQIGWLHAPKTATSFFNTIVRYGCDDLPAWLPSASAMVEREESSPPALVTNVWQQLDAAINTELFAESVCVFHRALGGSPLPLEFETTRRYNGSVRVSGSSWYAEAAAGGGEGVPATGRSAPVDPAFDPFDRFLYAHAQAIFLAHVANATGLRCALEVQRGASREPPAAGSTAVDGGAAVAARVTPPVPQVASGSVDQLLMQLQAQGHAQPQLGPPELVCSSG